MSHGVASHIVLYIPLLLVVICLLVVEHQLEAKNRPGRSLAIESSIPFRADQLDELLTRDSAQSWRTVLLLDSTILGMLRVESILDATSVKDNQ